ncbi:MAG: hypothetical protein JNK45_04275 [Myxococcales bacterium]|nr:hypothetical protein [Myxococcales bacterium]
MGGRAPLAAVALALLGVVGCAAAHAPPGASPVSARERRVVVADGVVVTATRWDATLVDLAAAAAPGPDRKDIRARLCARHCDGASFTVVVEIADRPRDGDVLLDPDTWWFQADGEAPTQVELVAIDRYPTGDGRAHVRMGFDVRFAPTGAAARSLRLGSKAAVSRRAELGGSIARRGVELRW